MLDTELDHVLRDIRDRGLAPDQRDAEMRVITRLRTKLPGALAVVADPPPRLRDRIRARPRLLAIGALMVLALGGGGVASALLTHDAAKLSAGVACYSNAQRVGGIGGTVLDGRPAVENCAEMWRMGGIIPGDTTPPPLQACVYPEGGKPIQVVPGDSPAICATIGLVSDPNAGADSGPYYKLSRILDVAQAHRCLSLTGAQRLARSALSDSGLSTTWTIKVKSTQLTSTTPCIGFGHDSDLKTIQIAPTDTPIDAPNDRTPGD